ncbi:MAG: tripartite tricarboxylate transporter substrate binding protein [Magnetovibrio sp.]|nr:tripartite tricarboxylate transporter substrate binding protein [Magnetovibrio sp.]
MTHSFSGSKRFAAKFVLCLVAGAFAAAPASPGNLPDKMEKPNGFPERPMTMLVPYGPGGGSGQLSRAMAEAVTEVTGAALNLEYKPGGSGTVGMKSYMAAPADGYSVMEHIDDATSAHALKAKNPNPAEVFVPLVTAQITFSQIYIRGNETRFTDWDSYVKYVKSKKGRSTIANVSKAGSMERVNLKFITDHFGMKMQQISFDKGGPRYAALKGGQVDALFEQPGDVRGFLDSGDFKPILTIYKTRPAAFKDVPAMNDVGLTFEPLLRFRGFYVHKDAPADRVKWLKWAFQKAWHQPSFQSFNKKKFMDAIDSFRDTEGSVKLINDTAAIYRKAYKSMGLVK